MKDNLTGFGLIGCHAAKPLRSIRIDYTTEYTARVRYGQYSSPPEDIGGNPEILYFRLSDNIVLEGSIHNDSVTSDQFSQYPIASLKSLTVKKGGAAFEAKVVETRTGGGFVGANYAYDIYAKDVIKLLEIVVSVDTSPAESSEPRYREIFRGSDIKKEFKVGVHQSNSPDDLPEWSPSRFKGALWDELMRDPNCSS